MRIERENGDHVGSVWAVLTPDEAWELLDSLLAHFCDDDYSSIRDLVVDASPEHDDPGWHSHVGGPDELTITIESPAST